MTENVFNPVALLREQGSVEKLADLIIYLAGVDVDDSYRKILQDIIIRLPEEANMATLINAIQLHEAEQLGIRPDEYDALSPLIQALKGANTEAQHHDEFHVANSNVYEKTRQVLKQTIEESVGNFAESSHSFASGYIRALADHSLISKEESLWLRDELGTLSGGPSLRSSIEKSKKTDLD